MKKPTSLWPAIAALVLVCFVQNSAISQVTENRRGEANPGAVLFHTTLYGAGTGLILGGAYALVKGSDSPSTGDVLRWGIAGGAGAGFVIGLVYLMSRPQPRGAADKAEMIDAEGSAAQTGMQQLLLTQRRDGLRPERGDIELRLVRVKF